MEYRNNQVVALRIDHETIADVRREAVERGIPASVLLRQALGLRRACQGLDEGQELAIVDTARRNKVVRFLKLTR